jgi:hypothetical protein
MKRFRFLSIAITTEADPDRRVQPVLKAQPDHKALKVFQVLSARWVRKVHLELKAPRVQSDPRATRVIKVKLVETASMGNPGKKVTKAIQV